MKTINEFLVHNSNLGTTLYYPGAGLDFESINDLIENTTITKVYLVDYLIELNDINISKMLKNKWEIIEETDLTPNYFQQNQWSDFWYNQTSAYEFSSPDNAFCKLLKIKNKLGKVVELYYLGTEAIKTYHILLNINNIKIDIIVLQDHGFGCNWNGQTFGFNKNQQLNLLYNLCKASINLPKNILLGQNTAIWPNYKQETKFEAQNDSSHKKALFTLI
jgi:hypothetical protein